MRIVSLLPAATEIIYFLNLQKNLAGISKDSNFPAETIKIPKITDSIISNDLKSIEIDRIVKLYKHKGKSVFHIKKNLLKKLNPDLVLTQELCPVCAPSFDDVRQACKIIRKNYSLISLEPHTIGGILENIKTIASFTNSEKIAEKKIKDLEERILEIKSRTQNLPRKSTLIIEWLDPFMAAGHWVPEMVYIAGATLLFSKKGERSRRISWAEIIKLDPEVLIISPCGFDIARTKKELDLISTRFGFKKLRAYRNRQIYLVDADAFLTRPGPRIIDGIEIFSEILYPSIFKRKYTEKDWMKYDFGKI